MVTLASTYITVLNANSMQTTVSRGVANYLLRLAISLCVLSSLVCVYLYVCLLHLSCTLIDTDK